VNTWYDYRSVWSTHPLVFVYAMVVLAVFVLSIIGTVVAPGPLAILFVPSLAGAYGHHVMVTKRLQR
jgi:hypothetical protein